MNATTFDTTLSSDFSCKLPLIAANSDTCRASPSENSGYFCSWGCTRSGGPNCGAKPKAGGRRFCPCASSKKQKRKKKLVQELDSEVEPEEDEDRWSERTEWTEMYQGAVELANTAKTAAAVSCETFTDKGACETNGCVYSEEEGEIVCATKSKCPFNVLAG